MSRLLDDDNDLLDQQRDRELTLSTGAIHAIFLALVLLCAIFFGFGYNLGRKSTVVSPTAPPAESSAPATSSESKTFDNFKPSPSETPSPVHSTAGANSVTVPVSSPSETAATTAATHPAKPAPATAAPPVRPPAATSPKAPTTAPTSSSAPAPATAAPKGSFVVQIAAVSRKDDADLLVNALHAKGYTVAERTEPQDKLVHIQVGPFSSRRDAEAMREKLIVDGYNAIVK